MTNGLKFEMRETTTLTSPLPALGRGSISTLAKRRIKLKWNGFNIEPPMESYLNTKVRKSHEHSSL